MRKRHADRIRVFRLQVESLLSSGMMWAGDYDTRKDAQAAYVQQYGDGRKFSITRRELP